MSSLGATRLFFLAQLAHLVRSRRMLLCSFAALGPALLAWFVPHFHRAPPRIEAFGYISWYLLMPVLTPVLALILGSAVISEELDDRTITYPFTRPVPRAAFFVGRLCASACVACVLVALAVATLFAACAHAGRRPSESELSMELLGTMLSASVGGAAVYAALFACIGVFLRHPMIVGIGYVFAVEVLITFLPGKTRELAVQHHLQSWVHESGAPIWNEVNQGLLSTFEARGDALGTLASIFLLALALGAWGVSRREYVLSA